MKRSRNITGQLQHWLLVLLSPLILGIIASFVVALGSTSSVATWMWWTAAGLLVIWIVLYLAAFTRTFKRPLEYLAVRKRSARFIQPHVLVLDGRLDERGTTSIPYYYTDKRPDEWHHALTSRNATWAIKTGPFSMLEDSNYDMVINPFGESYPEEDFALHTSLKYLTDWVRKGGVYVNVAGYPFWWQHNPVTGVTTEAGRWEIKVDNTSHIASATIKPILIDTLLGIGPDMSIPETVINSYQSDLDRTRYGEIAGAGGSSKIKIFRPYPMSTASMIPLLSSSDNSLIVIGAISYGLGYFVLSGVKIDTDSPAFDKVLTAIHGWSQYEARGRRP